MLLKETLKAVVESQKKSIKNSEAGIQRVKLKQIKVAAGHAAIITGIRRSGKSTLLRQVTDRFGDFNYVNFEDLRIFGFELRDFQKLEEAFSESSDSKVYFFDEIQNVEQWERYIRNLVDRKMKVVLTGSNASILDKELGSKLTGRHLSFNLYPFSFKEFLSLMNKNPSLKSFEEYFSKGGFPEYLKNKDEMILQQLLNDIIERDIVVRYKIRYSKIVKDLALYLLSNVGKEFSYQKLKKIYELGSVNTIINLISHYEDSYLLFTVPRFDFSYKKQLVNPKKIYAVDTGLIRANSVSFSNNVGRILENIVFLELKRRGYEIYYYNKDRECDFVIRDSNEKFHVFQVCYNLNEDNKDREMNGLIEAMEFTGCQSGKIMTMAQEDKFIKNGKNISLLPVWKWLSS